MFRPIRALLLLVACVLVTQVVIALFCVVLFRAPTALLYGLSALNGVVWGLALGPTISGRTW